MHFGQGLTGIMPKISKETIRLLIIADGFEREKKKSHDTSVEFMTWKNKNWKVYINIQNSWATYYVMMHKLRKTRHPRDEYHFKFYYPGYGDPYRAYKINRIRR